MTQEPKRIELPRPLPHQEPVLAHPARFKVLACGRRWGKTVLSIVSMVLGHGPDRQLRGALQGGNIWYIAPNYAMAMDTWRTTKRILAGIAIEKSEVQMRIELPGGGSITIRSADNPDSLRGSGLDGVVLDEAALLNETVWSEAIRPALSDRQGWAIVISTPRGMANWLFDLFQQAESFENWQAWQQPTSENSLIPHEEIEQARTQLGSRVFAQEFEAQFVSSATSVFKYEWFQFVTKLPDEVGGLVRYWDKAGTDGGGDYTAGVLIGQHEGIFYVIDVVRGQWSSHKRNEVIKQTAEEDEQRFGEFSLSVWIEQEPGSGGKESAEYTIRQLAGYSVYAERPTGDKVTRAQPFAAQAEAGNVRIFAGAWNKAYLERDYHVRHLFRNHQRCWRLDQPHILATF